MTINELQDEIIDEFSFFDDWMDRYEHIIYLGKKLPMIDPSAKTDEKLIKGCQSQVWLDAEEKDGKIHFTADSDAVITKGIVSLLIRILTNQPAKDIAEQELYFIDKIGLKEHLSPTRSNGLLSMVKQMKMYALKFS